MKYLTFSVRKTVNSVFASNLFIERLLYPWLLIGRTTGLFPFQKLYSSSPKQKTFKRVWFILSWTWSVIWLLCSAIHTSMKVSYTIQEPVHTIRHLFKVVVNNQIGNILTTLNLASFIWATYCSVDYVPPLSRWFQKYLHYRDRIYILLVTIILGIFLAGRFAIVIPVLIDSSQYIQDEDTVARAAESGIMQQLPLSEDNRYFLSYFLYVVSQVIALGVAAAQHYLIIICVCVGMSFGHLSEMLKLSFHVAAEKTTKSVIVYELLSDYATMGRQFRKFANCFSTALLIMYTREFLWVLYDLVEMQGAFEQIPGMIAYMGFGIGYIGVTTGASVYCYDKATALLEIVQEGVEDEKDERCRKILHLEIQHFRSQSNALNIAGFLPIRRDFVLTIIGLLVTYMLVIWDNNDHVQDVHYQLPCNCTS